MKRIVSLITAVIILASLCVFSASAATANAAVSVSSSTVKPGATFTVTVRVSSATKMGSMEGKLNYSSNIVEFVSGDGVNGAGGLLTLSKWDSTGKGVSEFKFVITFKAKAEGTSSFSFSSTEISDVDFNYFSNVSASSKVSVQKEKPLSSNNYLKSLKLSSGTLSPAFSKSVLNYTVKVPNSTTTMLLTPTVEDSTATTKVTGSSKLQVGSNTRKVTVTAQNGATRTYTIKIERAAATGDTSSTPSQVTPPVSSEEPAENVIYIDGQAMKVVDELPSDVIPKGFSATVAKLGDRDVMALTNNAGTLTMLYLQNSEGENKFFIYDSTDISYYPYQPLTVLGQGFILMDPKKADNLPAGFAESSLEIGDATYAAWENDSFKGYYLLYLCNDKGDTGFYCYDSTEGTIQRYMGAVPGAGGNQGGNQTGTPVIEKVDSAFGRIGLIVIIPLGGAFIALTVVLIVLLASKGKKSTAAPVQKEEDKTSFNDDFIIK